MLKLEIITPEKIAYSGEAYMVVIPAVDGDMGVLENHIPMVTKTKAGKIRVHISAEEGKVKEFEVPEAFVEITREKCLILADNCVAV